MVHFRGRMAREPLYEREHMAGGRHLRAGRWVLGIAIVALAALALSLVVPNQNERDVASKGAGSPKPDVGGAVGTSGGDTDYGPGEGTLGTLITELETITGTNDATQLVGRRVDLHADVQEVANDVAFWVGPAGNRLLVVLARDTRSGVERQTGEPSHHQIIPVRAGQQATISGVIRPVPYAEATDSWNLTRQDVEELAERKVYVRAERVSSNGHGAPPPPPSGH
jgi:hypothetical protein